MTVTELLEQISTVYAETQEKAKARDEAAAALNMATAQYQESSEKLSTLRDQLGDVLGHALPQADPRFRKSA